METRSDTKADSEGRFTLGAGSQFYLELTCGMPRWPLHVVPDDDLGRTVLVFDERPFRIEPFSKLEVFNATPGSEWYSVVAQGNEHVSYHARKRPVRLAYLRRAGNFVLTGGNSYALANNLDSNATVWTNVIDVRTFSHLMWRVSQGGGIGGATSVALEVFHADSNGDEYPRAGRQYSVDLPMAPSADLAITTAQFGHCLANVDAANFISRGVPLTFISGRLTVNTAAEQDPVTFYGGMTAELLGWN